MVAEMSDGFTGVARARLDCSSGPIGEAHWCDRGGSTVMGDELAAVVATARREREQWMRGGNGSVRCWGSIL